MLKLNKFKGYVFNNRKMISLLGAGLIMFTLGYGFKSIKYEMLLESKDITLNNTAQISEVIVKEVTHSHDTLMDQVYYLKVRDSKGVPYTFLLKGALAKILEVDNVIDIKYDIESFEVESLDYSK